MKKSLRLLCCLFISIFILGFGGERVLAEDAKVDYVPGDFWFQLNDGGYGSLVKKINGKYAFCLDSNLNVSENPLTLKNSLSGYKAGYKEAIERILTKAYQFGLENGQSTHTIKGKTVTDRELYGITQSAIWYAAHGYETGGLDSRHKRYIEQNEKFTEIYNYLIKQDSGDYNLNLTGGNGKLSEKTGDNDYLYSEEYTVLSNLPDGTTYSATVNGGEMKVNDGGWTSSSSTVKNGDVVVLRVSKPQSGSGEVSATLTVTSSQYISGVDVKLYESNDNTQNITTGVTEKDSKTKSIKVTGNFDNGVVINASKKDADTGELVGGALLQIYEQETGTVIGEVVSTENESSTEVPAVVGKTYCVKEISAPNGYIRSTEPVCSTIQDGDTTLSLSISDKKMKVRYRKVDEEGNPISGIEIKLYNFTRKTANYSDYLYICAITDDDGYLTRPCSGKNKTSDSYIDNGYYYVEEGGMYYIQEEFKNGYINPIFSDDVQDFAISFDDDVDGDPFDVVFAVTLQSQDFVNIVEGTLGVDEEITIEIKNKRSLNISKVDTGTGEEIKGAEMHLYDAECIDSALAQELGLSEPPYCEVDSWVSDGTPHVFVGIKPNHKYVLSETVPPKGYVGLQTDIEFEMDENGKVDVKTVQQDVKGSDESTNWLIVGNGIEAPSTGMSIINLFAIGGLMVFAGYEVIKIYRRRVNS